jgi:hypothetical protein
VSWENEIVWRGIELSGMETESKSRENYCNTRIESNEKKVKSSNVHHDLTSSMSLLRLRLRLRMRSMPPLRRDALALLEEARAADTVPNRRRMKLACA